MPRSRPILDRTNSVVKGGYSTVWCKALLPTFTIDSLETGKCQSAGSDPRDALLNGKISETPLEQTRQRNAGKCPRARASHAVHPGITHRLQSRSNNLAWLGLRLMDSQTQQRVSSFACRSTPPNALTLLLQNSGRFRSPTHLPDGPLAKQMSVMHDGK
jgi:hypothetical protein